MASSPILLPLENSPDAFCPVQGLLVVYSMIKPRKGQNVSEECSTGGEQELNPSFTHLITIMQQGVDVCVQMATILLK